MTPIEITADEIKNGREAERSAIVAWLRRRTDAPMGDAIRRAEANAIARGDHLSEGDK